MATALPASPSRSWLSDRRVSRQAKKLNSATAKTVRPMKKVGLR